MEMERNTTPQNARRHSKLKADIDKEKQAQTQSSWKTNTASLNMERDSQKLWRPTKSLNGDNSEQCRATLQNTNHRKGGSRRPCQFSKKRAQLHRQLTEQKISGPRHGLCSETQLVLALTHAWPNV